MNIKIHTIDTQVDGFKIPESLVNEVTGHVIRYLLDSYYYPAMQDYFMARLARFNHMTIPYAWLSSQCIEKLIKFNCSCFSLPLSKDGLFKSKKSGNKASHNYIPLFFSLDSKIGCYRWDLYEKIPEEETEFGIFNVVEYTCLDGEDCSIDFSNCKPSELVKYFNTVGHTGNRYGAKGISTGFIDILLLDSLVANLRNVCIDGDIAGEFRFATPQGVALFNRFNFQFKLPQSIYDDSDGYSANTSGLTYPELLLMNSNSGSYNLAHRWLDYRFAI